MKTADAQLLEIQRLLATYDRKFAAAFLEGVRVITDKVSLNEIAEQLRAHNVSGVMAIFNDALIAQGFIQLSRTLHNSLVSGGDYAASIANANKIVFGFQVSETNTARFMADYQAQWIKEMSAEMRKTITEIIYTESAAGTNPIETARKIKQGLGLTEHQEKAVQNYRQYLMDADKRALELRLRDARYDPTVARSIQEGVPPNKERVDKMVDAYRRRYIQRRAQNIARTESQTMLQAGQDAYWGQLVETGLVEANEIVRTWIVTRDSKLRHSHAAIPALNPKGRGFNEPFLSPLGMIKYPSDPAASAANRINCRCALFTRIERN